MIEQFKKDLIFFPFTNCQYFAKNSGCWILIELQMKKITILCGMQRIRVKQLREFPQYSFTQQFLQTKFHIILQKSTMASLCQGFYKRNLLTYQPQKWSKRLGEKCTVCTKALTHEKCVSLCKCYFFCHQKCFIESFEPLITNTNTDIKCELCQQLLDIQLSKKFTYGPSIDFPRAIKLVLSILLLTIVIFGIVLTLNNNIPVQIAFFALYLEGIILSLAIYSVIICIRNILYKTEIKLQKANSTKLDIQTSAFKDIDIQTTEQITKDCLYTNKK